MYGKYIDNPRSFLVTLDVKRTLVMASGNTDIDVIIELNASIVIHSHWEYGMIIWFQKATKNGKH